MNASDFRKEALNNLTGKWGKAVCIVLAYVAIFFIIGFIEGLLPESLNPIFSLITFIIEIPLALGFVFSFMKLFNDEDTNAFDFITLGFQNFAKSWAITFRILLKMILPVILIIISYALMIGGFVGVFGASMYDLAYSASMSTASSVAIGSASAGFVFMILLGFILFIVSLIWAMTKSYYYAVSYFIAADSPEMNAKDTVEKSKELMTGKRWKLFCLQFSFIGWAILAIFTLGIGYLWLIPYIQIANIAFYQFIAGKNSKVDAEVISDNTNNDKSTEE